MVHTDESLQFPRDFEGAYLPPLRFAGDKHRLTDIIGDYEGFGEEGFDPQWPNGARIAVSFVLNYEYVPTFPTLHPYLYKKRGEGGR